MFSTILPVSGWTLLAAVVIIIVIGIVSNKFRKNNKRLPTIQRSNIYLYLRWLLKTWYKRQDFETASFELEQLAVTLSREHGMAHIALPGILSYVLLFEGRTVQPILENPQIVEKDDFYVFFRPWLGKSLLVSPADTWRKRRKLLTPTFHFRILDNFLPTMDERARNLVKDLRDADGKDWIDIVPRLANCSMDIVCETIMGIGRRVKDEEVSQFFKSMTTVCEIIVRRVFHVWTRYDLIFYLTSEGRKFKRHLESMNKFILQVIDERKSALEKKMKIIKMELEDQSYNVKEVKPFLDIILEYHFNDPDFTLENVREEVSAMMFGGTETTTNTASWILYLLGKYPEIQKKVQAEVDEIFGSDASRPINLEDLKKMIYTERVIKESMRLYPAAPITGRTVSKDIDCCGYTIPKGTHCVILIYQIHRDPKVFPDPEVFNPDRFLPENSVGRHPFSYIPFSAGIRNCIGQKFGMMEIKTIIANVMKNFDLESLDSHVQPVHSVILRSNGPIRLRVKRRKRLRDQLTFG